eukprot:gene29631-38754_t
MLFSDSDRFKKPVINHPIDKQILCHIKPNTERHVGPGTYFSTSIEEKRSGWKPTSFSRRQPMTPVKVHQQNGYASRQDLYENGIIFSDGFMALPTSETKVVLPGPGDYNIPSDLVGDNSPHLKSSRKGATMGSSPRFACNPPNNLIYNDVLFSCSQMHHPNVSPGEYNMFQSCELIKNSHNIRAVSAASTAVLGRSMSVAKLKKIKEKQLGSTLAGDVTSPLSFHHRSTIAEGTANSVTSNMSPAGSPNVFDLPPSEINSNSSGGFISSHGRQYTPGSSIHRTKKLQKQQQPLRPKPLTDVRLTFGAPGSSFRIPSLSDVLRGSSGDFSPNGGSRPPLLRSNTNNSNTNSKGQHTAFSNHGSPAGDLHGQQPSMRAATSSHHRSASSRAWPSSSSPQPQQGRAYQKHANSEPESVDMFSDRRNLTDESIHDITGLHMSPLPFDDI